MLRAVYQKMSAPPPEIFKKEGFYQLQDLLKKYPAKPPKIEFNVKEDLVSLPYTGGTTGLPKAAMITHFDLVAAQHIAQIFWGDMVQPGKEVVIGYLPFYHIYGQSVVMTGSMSQGYMLIIFTTPDLDDILNAIENYKRHYIL